MIALWLSAWAAAAEPPTCDPLVPIERDALSVAWVSPAGASVVSGATWLTVVPTGVLRTWLDDEHADVARLLQGLGLRRAWKDPTRPWKVTVFEVAADELCRPLDPEADLSVADGIPVCERGDRGVDGKDEGCGTTIDRATGRPGLPVFQIRWRDAAARGFCVLPAERFVEGR